MLCVGVYPDRKSPRNLIRKPDIHSSALLDSMNQYATFESDLGACRKCQSILNAVPVDPCISDERVEPRSIVSGIRRKPILLIGQAPGKTEYDQSRPFQGR